MFKKPPKILFSNPHERFFKIKNDKKKKKKKKKKKIKINKKKKKNHNRRLLSNQETYNNAHFVLPPYQCTC
jgi:hypothetical protein